MNEYLVELVCCYAGVVDGGVERCVFQGTARIISEVGQRAAGLALAGAFLPVVGRLDAVAVFV